MYVCMYVCVHIYVCPPYPILVYQSFFYMCITTGIKRTSGPIEINLGMSTLGLGGMVIA